jgi:hypothetical protein
MGRSKLFVASLWYCDFHTAPGQIGSKLGLLEWRLAIIPAKDEERAAKLASRLGGRCSHDYTNGLGGTTEVRFLWCRSAQKLRHDMLSDGALIWQGLGRANLAINELNLIDLDVCWGSEHEGWYSFVAWYRSNIAVPRLQFDVHLTNVQGGTKNLKDLLLGSVQDRLDQGKIFVGLQKPIAFVDDGMPRRCGIIHHDFFSVGDRENSEAPY